MVREPVVECAFFIPTCRDVNLADGLPHAMEAWDWLDDELYARFAGRTLAPGVYEGFYRDPDTQQRVPDQSRKYLLPFPDPSLPN